MTRACSEPANAVAKGRVAKKQGLSRHYPAKAQSFDCMASLLAACDENTPLPTLVLSKSVSRRAPPVRCMPHVRSLSAKGACHVNSLRRTISSAALACCTSIDEHPVEDSSCSEESELCSALQAQATLQPSQYANTAAYDEPRGSDASSSLDAFAS